MTPERWQKIGELYQLALVRAPEERAAFLEDACPDDREVRKEVLSLLAQPTANGVLDHEALVQLLPQLAGPVRSLEGQRFGAYEIRSLIGSGGMGQVYRGHDTRLGRDVAIKVLPERLGADPERLARFLREARAASSLNHPNIVTIYDIGEEREGHFIVMELVHGRTFRHLAAERPAVPAVVQLAQQAARALAAAHAVGIVHRDIKPENLMVRDDGWVKVVDFGLARLMIAEGTESAARPGLTRGRVIGTLRYMSPEQAFGYEVTTATDVFSLGTVLYELATGMHPVGVESAPAVLATIAAEAPIGAARLNPEVPIPLDALLQRMLQKDPRARPSAEEVADALQAMTASPGEEPVQRQPPGGQRPMVGRESELKALWAALDQVRGGRGGMMVVAAEAGLGKTTLIESFLAAVKNSDAACRIGTGRCLQRFAGTGGYLPLFEAVEDLIRGSFDPAALHALKTIAPAWYENVQSMSHSPESGVPPAAAPSQDRMKRQLASVVEELAGQRPLILFIDDLHWADASTLDVIAYLSSRCDRRRLLILGTYRPSEVHRSNPPLVDLRREMVARGRCEELRLSFLAEADVDRYLALEYPHHHFPPEFARFIALRTEGHPLFMADLLRYLHERGIMACQDGRWCLSVPVASIGAAVPESMQRMIDRKLEQLGDIERRLLVAASVQGDVFDVAVVAAAVEMRPSELEERIQPAERLEIVRFVDEHELPDRTLTTRYQFVHVLYQNALYGSLRAARRAELCGAVAGALLRFHERRAPKIALQLAFLYEAARDAEHSSANFLTASQNAQHGGALKEAITLARRGLALLESLPPTDDRDRRELALQIALMVPAVSLGTHNAPEAQSAFGRIRELAEQLGERPPLVTILVGRVWARLSGGETHRALEDAEECLRVAEAIADPGYLVAAHFVAAGTATQLGDFGRGCRHYQAAVRLYDAEAHRHLAYLFVSDPGVHVRIEHAYVLFHMGEFQRALELAAEARTLARRSAHPFSIAAVLTRSITLELRSGRLREAERYLAELAAVLEQHELVHRLFLPYYRGWVAGQLGQVDEGVTLIRESVTAMRAVGFRYGIPSIAAIVSELLLGVGRVDEALTSVDEGLAEARTIGELHVVPELLHQRGACLTKASSTDERVRAQTAQDGEAAFREAIRLAREQGSRFYELRTLVSLARVLAEQKRRAEAAGLLEGICTDLSGEPDEIADLATARSLLTALR